MLIDVSGSMKAASLDTLRWRTRWSAPCRQPDLLLRHAPDAVTRLLLRTDLDAAMARLADTLADWDGGTAIGDSFLAFLDRPQHAALVRGAVVIVVSDGFERGDPAAMVGATGRLARLAYRLVWATPMLADPRYRPQTRAMLAALPLIDAADGRLVAGGLDRLSAALAAAATGPRGAAAHNSGKEGFCHDRHHRRASPHLAAGGPALAHRKNAGHGFLGPMSRSAGDYPAEEYIADAAPQGVTASVYVQANWAPAQALEEARWVHAEHERTGCRRRRSPMPISAAPISPARSRRWRPSRPSAASASNCTGTRRSSTASPREPT